MDQSVRGPEKEKKEKEKEKEENNCGKLLTCRLRRARQKNYSQERCCNLNSFVCETLENESDTCRLFFFLSKDEKSY